MNIYGVQGERIHYDTIRKSIKIFDIQEIIKGSHYRLFVAFLKLAYNDIYSTDSLMYLIGNTFPDFFLRGTEDINIDPYVMYRLITNKKVMKEWGDFLFKKFPNYKLILSYKKLCDKKSKRHILLTDNYLH